VAAECPENLFARFPSLSYCLISSSRFFFALALSFVGWSFEVVKLDKGKVDGQWLQNRQPVPAVVVGLYKGAVTTDN
jgi:hypothetical protein